MPISRKTRDPQKPVNNESGRRLYVGNLPYQEHMQLLTQKYVDGVRLVKQSEFKKPYREEDSDYPTMEYKYDQPNALRPPPGPGIGIPADCTVGWEAAGAIEGWRICAEDDDCAGWVFTCAHKIKSFVCVNCDIETIEYLPGDRVLIIICSKNDEILGKYVTSTGTTGLFKAQRVCCDPATPPSIGYTSQQMLTNGTQALSVNLPGNGGPYVWTVTSGGGTLSSDTGTSVVYTAPASNANCALNPIITLTDKCGFSDTLAIAVTADAEKNKVGAYRNVAVHYPATYHWQIDYYEINCQNGESLYGTIGGCSADGWCAPNCGIYYTIGHSFPFYECATCEAPICDAALATSTCAGLLTNSRCALDCNVGLFNARDDVARCTVASGVAGSSAAGCCPASLL